MNDDREFWDAQAGTYEEAKLAVLSEGDWDHETHRHLDIIDAGLQPWRLPDGPLVEIGCGVGRLTWPMANAWDREVVGLDISPMMLTHAAAAYGPEVDYIARPHFELIDEHSFANWRPAGIYSMLVLQHLCPEDLERILGQASDALRPGGRMVLQFVEGDEQGAHSFNYSLDDIIDALKPGMGGTAESDWVFPQWIWLTVVKP